MAVEMDHLRRLAATLRGNLEKCAADPGVDPVHDVRTGTRRVQALVEMLVRESPDETVKNAADAWLGFLKKLRRAAGEVRDLDVHRKLLDKLMKRGSSYEGAGQIARQGSDLVAAPSPDLENFPATVLPLRVVEQQADDLDTWLKHSRQHQAAALKKGAAKWLTKFDALAASFEAAVAGPANAGKRSRPAAVIALEAFVRLADQMQQLDAGNLHDFRKGAKKARYLAETGGEDEHATAVGKALKKLQDEIGDWHDRLVLAEEARTALDRQGAELIALLDAERDRYYVQAMKTTVRLRGKLMGEWLALGRQRRA